MSLGDLTQVTLKEKKKLYRTWHFKNKNSIETAMWITSMIVTLITWNRCVHLRISSNSQIFLYNKHWTVRFTPSHRQHNKHVPGSSMSQQSRLFEFYLLLLWNLKSGYHFINMKNENLPRCKNIFQLKYCSLHNRLNIVFES